MQQVPPRPWMGICLAEVYFRLVECHVIELSPAFTVQLISSIDQLAEYLARYPTNPSAIARDCRCWCQVHVLRYLGRDVY
eukprot:8270518-Pyramimonas_sp.AAC.1